jgi:hypothetical protein
MLKHRDLHSLLAEATTTTKSLFDTACVSSEGYYQYDRLVIFS